MKISEKTYSIADCAVFSKTVGRYGGLSNMASGYSLFVNEINIANTEVLYQSCRFPLFPEIQKKIIAIENPMEAKSIARKYQNYTRQDWENVKVDIMRWCLKIKLIQNKERFSDLLIATSGKQIVEYSTKDSFWGALPAEKGKLHGKNVLGRLLIEIRETILLTNQNTDSVSPLAIPAFLVFNKTIDTVYNSDYFIEDLDGVYAY